MSGVFAELNLSSGFVVHVKALPPYYKDFIEDAIPYVPVPKRTLHLLTGDDVSVEYIVPETFPEEPEEQELYLLYKTALSRNEEIDIVRARARMNFLLVNCVEVVSGSITIDDPAWISKLEMSLPSYKVPTDAGLRYIAFIKSQVITSQPEMEAILNASLYTEVDMQGIVAALHHFQDTISRAGIVGSDTVTAGAQ
jgi:hypothetical protein